MADSAAIEIDDVGGFSLVGDIWTSVPSALLVDVGLDVADVVAIVVNPIVAVWHRSKMRINSARIMLSTCG